MELDLHQGHGKSGNAQECQSRQDNTVVVVDGECSESKYAYEIMRNLSSYPISLLTDDTKIVSLVGKRSSIRDDPAST